MAYKEMLKYWEEEGITLVKKSGQPFDIDRNGGSMKTLYSEGLY